MLNATRNVARKYAAKVTALPLVALAAVQAHAQVTSPIDDIFEAIDFTSVSAKVLAAAIVVIGIAMVFKGTDLGKRTVNKV